MHGVEELERASRKGCRVCRLGFKNIMQTDRISAALIGRSLSCAVVSQDHLYTELPAVTRPENGLAAPTTNPMY